MFKGVHHLERDKLSSAHSALRLQIRTMVGMTWQIHIMMYEYFILLMKTKDMKIQLLHIFLITVCIATYSTFDCSAQSGSDDLYTVTASKMNVFYIGVDNIIQVKTPGIPSDSIHVYTDNGTVTRIDNENYYIRVSDGILSNVIVCAGRPDGEVFLTKSMFRIKPIPTPIPKLSSKESGNFTRQEIIDHPVVLPVFMNVDFDLRAEVVSFDFTYLDEDARIKSLPGKGYKLTHQMIGIIMQSKTDDRFWIENITCTSTVCKELVKCGGSISVRIVE